MNEDRWMCSYKKQSLLREKTQMKKPRSSKDSCSHKSDGFYKTARKKTKCLVWEMCPKLPFPVSAMLQNEKHPAPMRPSQIRLNLQLDLDLKAWHHITTLHYNPAASLS